MSKNIDQIFTANPITTNANTDLMYFGQSPYGVNDDAAMEFSDFAAQFATALDIQQQVFISGPDTGTADNYIVTLSPVPLSLTNNMLVIFTPANGNLTTTPMLDVSGFGQFSIVLGLGQSPVINDLASGRPAILLYSTADVSWQLLNPQFSGSSPWFIGGGTSSAIGGDTSTTAPGSYGVAYGITNTTAGGDNSFAFGSNANASADFAVAWGAGVASSGTFSFGFGSGIASSGTFSFAFGQNCGANTDFCWAIGNGAQANNAGSYVWGDGNATPPPDTAVNQWVQTFAGGYYWYLNNTPTLAIQIDIAGNFTNALGVADLSKFIVIPSTGDTVTLVTTNFRTILNPATTLATLTVQLPATPVDGQLQLVSTTQIISALTIDGNGNTVAAPLSALVAAQSFTMIYNEGDTTWYPG